MGFDKDLVNAIENGAAMHELEETEGWQLIKRACEEMVERSKNELLLVDATNVQKIIMLQERIKLYGNFLPNLIDTLKQQGKMAFDEAKQREMSSM